MKIGLVAITSRHLEIDPNSVSLRDFFQSSPLFRYSVAYCEQKYDEVFVLSIGSRKILHLENDACGIDFQLNALNKREKKVWLREVSNDFRQFVEAGAEVYIHAPNWYRRIADWLEPDYKCYFPMKGKAIGQQLHFLKSEVGEITYQK